MKKILICGATGFIGRNLVNYFNRINKYQIYATYNKKKPFKNDNIQKEIKWRKANLLNKDDIVTVLKDIDIVIQAAATTSGSKDIVTKPYIHVTDNAVMNSLLLREAMNSGIKHFVFFSCSVMYPSSAKPIRESDWDPAENINKNYFGIASTKIYIEKMLDFYSRVSEMKTTAIRHSNVYGPFDKFDLEKSHVFGASTTKVLTAKKEVLVWGDGKEKRDLIHVEDLCKFVELVLDHQSKKFRLYNCGSGSLITVKKLIEQIIKESGKVLALKFDTKKPSIKTEVLLDFSLARQEIGWNPSVSLNEGITKTIAWWKKNIDPKNFKIKS